MTLSMLTLELCILLGMSFLIGVLIYFQSSIAHDMMDIKKYLTSIEKEIVGVRKENVVREMDYKVKEGTK